MKKKTPHSKTKKHLEQMGVNMRYVRKRHEEMFMDYSLDCYFRKKSDSDTDDFKCNHPTRRTKDEIGYYCRLFNCHYFNTEISK